MTMETACSNVSQIACVTSGNSTGLPYTRQLATTIKVLAPLWPVILTIGFISNITNICVFLKVGVKENVTALFLSLAMSDLTFLVLITPTMCGMFIKAYDEDYLWPFHYKFSYCLLYWPAFTAYDLSAFISVSLGVTRCACVAMPLKFKAVFTKSRTIKWVLFLVVVAVALRIPVLTIFRVAYRKKPSTNIRTTPYVAMYGKPRADVSYQRRHEPRLCHLDELHSRDHVCGDSQL